MKTVSETLSDFATGLKYEDLPDEALRYGKHLLLDTLGVALGGYLSEPSRITRSFVREMGGRPEATIIGSGEKTICSQAAFLNGVMVRYLDFCDVYHGLTPCHPSENIPAALAVGEREHSSGREVMLAIVLGYEFECRFTDAVPLDRLGWHHVTTGGYVVPLVAGRLLGLSKEQMVNAVGISGSTNHTFYGRGQITMMKAMGYPLASQNGINAALMARKGITGPRSIIETFNRTVARDVDLTPLTKGGSDLRILHSSIKPYAAAGMIQSPLTALFAIVKQHGIKPDDVDQIQLRTYEFATAHAAQAEAYRPETRESADHSLPYCIAIALIEGALGTDQFRNERWKDPEVLKLMAKVTVATDPELEKLHPHALPAHLDIRTKKGERFSQRVDHPKGDPLNPLTDEEIEAKFRSLASPLMGEHRITRIIQMANDIEEVDDIGELMDALAV